MASSASGVQCYASCPPSTVTIQPPPFTLTIPGPALYCPDQPMNIQQYNPCANVGSGGGRGPGDNISLMVNGSSVGGDAGRRDGFSEDALVDIGDDADEFWGWYPRRYGPSGRYGPWGYGPSGRYGPWGYGTSGRYGPWGYGTSGRGPWGYGTSGHGPHVPVHSDKFMPYSRRH